MRVMVMVKASKDSEGGVMRLKNVLEPVDLVLSLYALGLAWPDRR
jgi:hypothetical protein